MLDRPTRTHKRTKPFEYHEPLTPSSTVAEVGRPAPVKPSRSHGTQSTLNRNSTSNDFVLGSLPADVLRSRRIYQTRQRDSEEQRAGSGYSFSRPTRSDDRSIESGDSEVADDSQVYSQDDPKRPVQIRAEVSSRGKTRIAILKIPCARTESDDTIEQWYQDPYQRIDPDGPGYDECRRQNMERLLQENGFSKLNATQLTAWLMRCGGRWRPMKDTKSTKSSLSVKNSMERDTKLDINEANDAIGHTEISEAELAKLAQLEDSTSSVTSPVFQQGIDDLFDDSDAQDKVSEEGASVASTQHFSKERLESVGSVQPSDTVKRGPGRPRSQREGKPRDRTKGRKRRLKSSKAFVDPLVRGRDYDELSDDDKIAIIKRSLKIFDLVYGPDQPACPDYVNFEVDHLSNITTVPRAKPKNGYRTQGHKNLKLAVLPRDSPALRNHMVYDEESESCAGAHDAPSLTEPHSPQVWTEDPAFGLCRKDVITKTEGAVVARAQKVGQKARMSFRGKSHGSRKARV